MAHIIYIHGAGATHRSFHWLRAQLAGHRASYFRYSAEVAMAENTSRLRQFIGEAGFAPVVLLGHSLGGLLAAACATHDAVERVVTLNAPFGGIPLAGFASLFCSSPLLRDLSTMGRSISALHRIVHARPMLGIVGTCGLPFTGEPGDGVVPVASQRALRTPRYVEFPLNHFETLLDHDVAERIDTFISERGNFDDDPAVAAAAKGGP